VPVAPLSDVNDRVYAIRETSRGELLISGRNGLTRITDKAPGLLSLPTRKAASASTMPWRIRGAHLARPPRRPG